MMMNLFSIFDPSMSYFKLNWMSLFIILMVPMIFVMKSSKLFFFFNQLKVLLNKETMSLLNKEMKGMKLFLMISFFVLMIINVMALFPFIFTPSGHMVMSFPLALLVWLSFMFMGWKNFTKSMLSHLVPLGTPFLLMNFMVLIEMISNMIRPLTLSIRLSANMIAGHLLLSLLGSFSLLSSLNFWSSLLFSMILMMLELAVSVIQAYVFMTLITLYSVEI